MCVYVLYATLYNNSHQNDVEEFRAEAKTFRETIADLEARVLRGVLGILGMWQGNSL